jgi:CheY-like chemotaxis protein
MTAESTHVLIAEDDDDDYFIFSVAAAESTNKIILTRAKNGALLLEQLERELPHIVFLDMLMPVLDGHQCLKTIRANKRYDSVPIIVYTSLKDLESVEFCYREGSNLFVIKPDTFADLKKILERILSIDWTKTMYYPPRKEFVVSSTHPGEGRAQ